MDFKDVKIGMMIKFKNNGRQGKVLTAYPQTGFKRNIEVEAQGPEWFFPHRVWVSSEEIEPANNNRGG